MSQSAWTGGWNLTELGWAPQHPWCLYCVFFQRLSSPRWGTHKKFKWESKALNLPPAPAAQHPAPSQLLNLCGSSPSPNTTWNAPVHSVFAPGKPSPCSKPPSLSWHTEWPFPTSHKYSCALCPPNTDEGPQAGATPQEGAPRHELDGGLPVSPGDPPLLLEEQRANSLTPAWKPRNRTGASQRGGSQTQQQIKGEKKTKDDYYYLKALRLCLYWAEAAAGWGAQEPRGLSWGTWPCSCQALPSSRAACCPGKQLGWINWFVCWGVEPALMFWC